jgi:hypothetical protein
VTTHHLRLPGWRTLTVTETTDTERAQVIYRFQAPHAAGALALTPALTCGQYEVHAVYDGVRVQLGIGGWFNDDRAEPPILYGVQLTGGVILDPFEYVFNPWYLRFHRPTGRSSSTPAPETTSKYMAAIVTEALALWIARPDLHTLARTARREAASRLASLRHGPIRARQAEIATASAELDRLQALAAELETLAAEHTATRPQELTAS